MFEASGRALYTRRRPASTVRQVSEAPGSQFPVNSTAPIEALVTGARAPAQLTAYLHRIDAIPGVTGAQVTGIKGGPGGAGGEVPPGKIPPVSISATGRPRCPRRPGPSSPRSATWPPRPAP